MAQVAETMSITRAARLANHDNLKTLLVAVIIAGHGAMSYSDLEGAWPYQDVQEVRLTEVSGAVLGTLSCRPCCSP
jgi:hypothetical protein